MSLILVLIAREAFKSFTMTAPYDWQKPSAKYIYAYVCVCVCVCVCTHVCVLHCMYSHFTEITYILTWPHLFGTFSQSCLRCSLPYYSLHFAPNITQFTTLTLCFFFFLKSAVTTPKENACSSCLP